MDIDVETLSIMTISKDAAESLTLVIFLHSSAKSKRP